MAAMHSLTPLAPRAGADALPFTGFAMSTSMQMQPAPTERFAPSEAQDSAIMRKVSRRVLGFIFLLFIASFLDRINIGFAGLTMIKDLGLSATQFGTATSLFYLAYIACGIPSNFALARIGARRWISSLMVIWGVASSATMFATDAHTLYALRVAVGIAEAGFLPGMLLYLTYWFPAAYRARANALFMLAMPVTAALGSAVSGVLLGLNGQGGLRGWQWMFLLEGSPAAILGIVAFFYLNDAPRDALWLTAQERESLIRTLASDRPPERPTTTRLLPKLLSKGVILGAIAYFCLVNTLSMLAAWTPLIVKGFNAGASNLTIGLLAAIPQVCTALTMLWWGKRSDRHGERHWHTAGPMLFAAGGWLMTALSNDQHLQLLGLCMACSGAYAAMTVFWTIPDRSMSLQVRAMGIAVVNALGNISSVVSPAFIGWLKDVTHTFTAGLFYATALLFVGATVILAMRSASVAPTVGR